MDNSTANLNPGIPQPIDQSIPQTPPDPGAVYGGGSSKKKIIGIVVGVLLLVFIIILGIFILRRPANTGNAEVVYWGIWEDEAVFNEIIEDFETQNPNITIKYEKRTDIKDAPGGGYVPFLNSRIQAGTGPDIFRYHSSWLFALKDNLAPLPADVSKEINLQENYFSVISEDLGVSGAYYGVPLGYDSLVMFVNDELVSAGGYSVPADWSSFLDVARALTVTDQLTGEIKTAGTAMGTYDNVAHAADIVSLLAVQRGINMSALAGLVSGSEEERLEAQKEAKEKMADVLDFYTCFAIESDICAPVWNTDMPNSKLAFVQGKVAFYFGYSWDLLEMKAANPEISYSIHPVPKLESQGQGASTLAGYWVEGVSIKSKVQPQAFQFLQFLSKKENMEKLFKAQANQRVLGVAYPRRDMASLLSGHPDLGPVISQAQNAHSSLFYSETYGGGQIAALEGYMGNAVRSVISTQNNVSTKTAVDTLAKGVNQVFTKKNAQQSQTQ